MNELKMISLFAGIGAVEVAAKRVFESVKIVAAAEIDKFARKSYMSIHDIDEEHFYTDVRTMDGTQYNGKVDLVAFGFPCQDYSIAGKRAGLEGQRGTLFYDGARIIKEARPRYFIAENVKGLLSSNGGKDFETIMDILRNDLGYFCHWEVLNTKDYGVPQNRERVFIVGFLDHESYYRFQFSPKIPLEKRLKDVLEEKVDLKYYLSSKMVECFKRHSEKMEERGNGFKWSPKTGDDIGRCITARVHKCGVDDNYINEGVVGMLDIKGNEQIRRVYGSDGTEPCLQTMQGGNREPKIVAMRGRNPENPKSRESGLETVQKDNLVLEPEYRIRKLTPLECWRLQDFPDEAHEKAKAAGVSDSQRYKQAGNSMTVAVMEMIFRQLEKSLSGEYCHGQGRLF